MSKSIKYVAMKGNKKIAEGSTKNFKTNKPVLDIARKALAEKLNGKHSLCRVTIIRDGEKAGEWTCSPLKSKKKKAA